MSKGDFEPGTSTIQEYFQFIGERHQIYLNRKAGKPKPWTDDPILQQYKFTNVYRQLDRGTVALRNLLQRVRGRDTSMVMWTIGWYRLFNLDSHANHWTLLAPTFTELRDYLYRAYKNGEKIFTSAHMTTGRSGEDKIDTYLRAAEQFWDRRFELMDFVRSGWSMEGIFHKFLEFYMVGKFVAYEMACDVRFAPGIHNEASDMNLWANVGPGAARGLRRLGLKEELASMVTLLHESKTGLPPHVFDCEWPWELREIEHCLCEFDKYCRAKRGEGRPRQNYDGRGE